MRNKAILSLLWVRNVSTEEASEAVDSVFEKCYNDREPLGRIPRRNSRDPQRMYAEARLFGYIS